MIHTWLTRRARRQDISARYEAIVGAAPDTATLNLLDVPAWTEVGFDLLKTGIHPDWLDEAMKCTDFVTRRADCSREYAAQWVAQVSAVTGNGQHAILLAQWLKPERD